MKLLGFVVGLLVLGIAFLLLTDPHTPPETAQAYYERYRTSLKAGHSFEVEASYYTTARQAEVSKTLSNMGEGAVAAQNAYMTAMIGQTRCSTVTLSDQQQIDGITWLTYDVEDTCGMFDAETTVQEVIGLVQEDGWKIQTNESRIQQN